MTSGRGRGSDEIELGDFLADPSSGSGSDATSDEAPAIGAEHLDAHPVTALHGLAVLAGIDFGELAKDFADRRASAQLIAWIFGIVDDSPAMTASAGRKDGVAGWPTFVRVVWELRKNPGMSESQAITAVATLIDNQDPEGKRDSRDQVSQAFYRGKRARERSHGKGWTASDVPDAEDGLSALFWGPPNRDGE